MPPIPFWARPRFIVLVILAYLAAHFAIRMALGPGLSVDDTEQALLAQRYALTYSYRSPTLVTWLLVTLGHFMPVGVVAISLVRYGFLTLAYGSVYLTARRLISDPRLAALAVYSFAAIHILAESSHRNLSHSIALAAMIAVSWYVFVRLAASERLGWYLALGVAFGLGMLAKWNFVIFTLALPLACLLNAEGRRLVLSWKTLPSIAVAAAITAPVFFASLAMEIPDSQDIQSALGAEGSPGLAAIWDGTLTLVDTSLLYLMPLLPIAALVLGLPFWRGFRARSAAAGVRQEPPHPGAGVVGPSIAIGLALLWLIVFAVGATELKVRYMHPLLLIVPVWLFMTIEADRPSALALNLFALIMAALAVQTTGARILQPLGLVDCGLCMEWRPYPSLAAQLVGAGYNGTGTIVADGETGGNLRAYFPKARVIDPSHPLSTWPAPSGAGQCLVLSWDNGDLKAREANLERIGSYLANQLAGDPAAAHRDGAVSAPMIKPANGSLELGYRLYDGPVGNCR